MGEIFNVYVAGLLVNLLAGFIGWYLISRLFEWLPTAAQLHERFRAITTEKDSRKKLTEITLVVFLSFYWLFFANLIWVFTYFCTEVLSWPQILVEQNAQDLAPGVLLFLQKMTPGLVWGRSLLFLMLIGYSSLCFFRGMQIARQCWDVYKAIRIEDI